MVGSNDIDFPGHHLDASLNSIDIAEIVCQLWRCLERRGIFCFVLQIPNRYESSSGQTHEEIQRRSQRANLALARSLPEGRLIKLLPEMFQMEYFKDAYHWHDDGYATLATIVRQRIIDLPLQVRSDEAE